MPISVNVSDITLLDQMEERYQVKEQIRHQLINAVNKSSNMLFEMSQNMQQVSSLLMKMVHVPKAKIEVDNATEIKQCFVKGICKEGHFLDVAKADNFSSCLERCEIVELCQWISFDLKFNFCSLFKDCPNIAVRLPSELPEYSFQKKNGTYFKHITSKVNCPREEVPCNATGRCQVCLTKIQPTILLISLFTFRVPLNHWK